MKALIIAVGMILTYSVSSFGGPCPGQGGGGWQDNICAQVGKPWPHSQKELERTAQFHHCATAYDDGQIEEMKKEGRRCNGCFGLRNEAVMKCKQYLTPAEIQCEASATTGAEMGDPFRCERPE